MGRELRRVPLDFKWAIGQIWKGYVSPYEMCSCKKCNGEGTSQRYRELEDKWLTRGSYYKPNPYHPDRNYAPQAWKYNLDADDIKALKDAGKLDMIKGVLSTETIRRYILESNDWFFDSRYMWIVIKAKLAKEGKSNKCEFCGGEGGFWFSEEIQKAAKEWESQDPPTGEGYQLWETTSEGSPKSPVFETLEALCEYLAKEGISTSGSNTATYEQWMSMLSDGCVYHQEGNAIFI